MIVVDASVLAGMLSVIRGLTLGGKTKESLAARAVDGLPRLGIDHVALAQARGLTPDHGERAAGTDGDRLLPRRVGLLKLSRSLPGTPTTTGPGRRTG